LIGIALLMLLVAVAIGWALAAWTQRPLDQLRAATLNITVGGNLARSHAPTDSGPPEVRELAHEFNSMIDTIDSLLGAQRAFVADASHQLRTPLAALRLRFDNLLAASPGTTSLLAAQLEVDRLAAIIDGLLALARVDGTSAQPSVVDVADIARTRIETWDALALERNIELSGDIAEGQLFAKALPGSLEQVLDNLIDNALEATPDGGTIHVKAQSVPGASDIVTLVVTDSGRGMSAEEREHAFDRFWRAGDAAPGGSGLGLAIVRELVEHSGGEVTLAPAQQGTGLRVRITLRT
ncbi:MAG: HAMP domain-containing histidine kinase, partial [Thermoleophilia bacterium]|nr:HAMP domain-containing histidine kinase [Thermoleophilia bacterium]